MIVVTRTVVALRPDQREVLDRGAALDADAVYFEYITMHDDRVRPSHAALDGSIWRIDDPFAPVPPCGYNCRCSMRYVAKSNSPAAQILPIASAPLRTRAEVFADHLDEIVPDWQRIAAEASKVKPDLRFATVVNAVKTTTDLGAQARDIAAMILEAATADAKASSAKPAV
jgi:hypothetical protein